MLGARLALSIVSWLTIVPLVASSALVEITPADAAGVQYQLDAFGGWLNRLFQPPEAHRPSQAASEAHLPLPTLPAPPPVPTNYDFLLHGSLSTGWTTFAGPGVSVIFGNFAWPELDLTVPGRGPGFAFLRTYSSASSAEGPLGRGWTHSHILSLTVESSTSIVVRMADGRLDRYAWSSLAGWASSAGIFNILTDNGDNTFPEQCHRILMHWTSVRRPLRG